MEIIVYRFRNCNWCTRIYQGWQKEAWCNGCWNQNHSFRFSYEYLLATSYTTIRFRPISISSYTDYPDNFVSSLWKMRIFPQYMHSGALPPVFLHFLIHISHHCYKHLEYRCIQVIDVFKTSITHLSPSLTQWQQGTFASVKDFRPGERWVRDDLSPTIHWITEEYRASDRCG